jgi:hypothetical protein
VSHRQPMLSDRPVSSTAARKFARALSRKRRGSKQGWRWTCASSRIVRDVLSVRSGPDVEPSIRLTVSSRYSSLQHHPTRSMS